MKLRAIHGDGFDRARERAHPQPRGHLFVFCPRCAQHHVAFAYEREDDTEWIVDHGACRARVAAPFVGAAADHPVVVEGVQTRLERALQPDGVTAPAATERPAARPPTVEVDAWSHAG